MPDLGIGILPWDSFPDLIRDLIRLVWVCSGFCWRFDVDGKWGVGFGRLPTYFAHYCVISATVSFVLLGIGVVHFADDLPNLQVAQVAEELCERSWLFAILDGRAGH